MKTQSGTRRQGGKSGKARGGYTCRNLNDNAAAAASAARLLLYALLTEATRSGGSAGLAGLALCLLVVLANLADKVGECFVDVDALLGGRLDEAAAEVLCEIAALCNARARTFSIGLRSKGYIDIPYRCCRPDVRTPSRTYWRRQLQGRNPGLSRGGSAGGRC